jgi:hypothetical protein
MARCRPGRVRGVSPSCGSARRGRGRWGRGRPSRGPQPAAYRAAVLPLEYVPASASDTAKATRGLPAPPGAARGLRGPRR